MTSPPIQRPPVTGGGASQRIAGLPVWGWVALAAAGGIATLLWIQSRKSASSSAASQPAIELQGSDTQALLDQLQNMQGQPSTSTTTTPAQYENNAAWTAAAVAWYMDPTKNKSPAWDPAGRGGKIYNALHSWIVGIPIWPDEWQEIGKIVAAIGPPPDAPAGQVKLLGR